MSETESSVVAKQKSEISHAVKRYRPQPVSAIWWPVSELLNVRCTCVSRPPFPFLFSPFSDGEHAGQHRHDVGLGGSHDVPQPPHGDVHLLARADRWRAGRAQRLLPGLLGHARVPRPGPGLG